MVIEKKISYIRYGFEPLTPMTNPNHINPGGSKTNNLLSMDEVFLRRLKKAIEDNLETQDFSVDDLGHEIGLSRSQIHRKLQSLTGKSASRFIRSYKLEKARELLKKRIGTVSEISYKLGFSSPAYFGQVYTEEFGNPPSEDAKEIQLNTRASGDEPEGHLSGTRRLAAIMFTDIAGYTSLMGSNEQKALELIRQNRNIQKPLIEGHNGKWLKEIGDGVLAQFDSAYDAVLCAARIQQTAKMDLHAKIRIGIHLGDVTVENEDVYGDGVNIASRIEGVADPGGIYISESIQRAIRGRTEFQLLKLGEVQLKNVDFLVNIWCLQGEGLPVPSAHKIRQLRASGIKETGVPLANVNDKLIQDVFAALMKTKPSISKYLYVDDDEDEEPDIRELADLIIRNFPWIIGVELRRLFSGSLRILNNGRLNQILITIQRSLQFLAYLILIEFYERSVEGKIYIDKNIIQEIKSRFMELSADDFVWIIKTLTKIFNESKIERFIPEMTELLNEDFLNLLDFKFPQKDENDEFKIEISGEDITRECIDYQDLLASILITTSFITNYKLVTIKEIKVLKARHKDPRFQHWIDILSSSDSDFRSKQEVLDSFSDSNAVLFMKSLKRPGEFLNLSPLIIDTRGEIIDTREKFNLKKDIFICEGFSGNHIRYKGTEVTEGSDLRSLNNYHELVEDLRQIIELSNHIKEDKK